MSHNDTPRSALRDLTDAPFTVRLGLARHILGCPECVAAWRGGIPLHVADQLEAASAEIAGFVPLVGQALRFVEPGRGWHQRAEVASREKSAHLLAGLLGCAPCCHLRTCGPQPAFARLPLRRLECRRCVATLRRPPAEDADRCDLCGTRGTAWFVPFAIASGPALVTGDACARCADVLGLGDRERAS